MDFYHSYRMILDSNKKRPSEYDAFDQYQTHLSTNMTLLMPTAKIKVRLH